MKRPLYTLEIATKKPNGKKKFSLAGHVWVIEDSGDGLPEKMGIELNPGIELSWLLAKEGHHINLVLIQKGNAFYDDFCGDEEEPQRRRRSRGSASKGAAGE